MTLLLSVHRDMTKKNYLAIGRYCFGGKQQLDAKEDNLAR